MKEKIKTALSLMMMGALMMAGMKAVDFTVGNPPIKVLVCFNGESGNLETCKQIDDLAKARTK